MPDDAAFSTFFFIDERQINHSCDILKHRKMSVSKDGFTTFHQV
jgi:hypothetical protein